jgi:hypothetical protein
MFEDDMLLFITGLEPAQTALGERKNINFAARTGRII